jgi:ATP-dependent helicase/nuclease subunit A
MGDIECYEQALRAQGLSTLASAGVFWERQEVADLLAYLRALADPADEVAPYGALAAPPVDLSSDGLALLARAAQAQGRGVWNVACDLASGTGAGENRDAERTGAGEGSRTGSGGAPGPDAWQEQLSRTAQFCAWLGSEREIADELTLAQLLERGIEHGGHLARMAVGEGAERRLANVRKLMALAEEWEHSEGRDLRGFLDEAAFQQGAGGRLASAEAIAEPDAPTADLDRDAVRLMSVHAAKGLEFETVCIADLGRAPSMSLPDLLVSDGRIGVRMVGLEDPEPQPALEFADLAQERRDAQAEEEDRIVYVAMTRARERLLLSGAVDFASWPRERPGAAPIVWLAPALSPAVPALCAQARAEPLISAVAHVISGHDAASPEDTAPSPGVASVNVLADASRQSRQLTVEGTDVPMLCRLNTPGPGA